MRATAVIVLAMPLLGVVACAPIDPGHGNAVRQNMAAQIIDPDPKYPDAPLAASSGDRAALAMRRYRTGTVINPRPPSGVDPFSGAGQGGGGAAGGGPR